MQKPRGLFLRLSSRISMRLFDEVDSPSRKPRAGVAVAARGLADLVLEVPETDIHARPGGLVAAGNAEFAHTMIHSQHSPCDQLLPEHRLQIVDQAFDWACIAQLPDGTLGLSNCNESPSDSFPPSAATLDSSGMGGRPWIEPTLGLSMWTRQTTADAGGGAVPRQKRARLPRPPRSHCPKRIASRTPKNGHCRLGEVVEVEPRSIIPSEREVRVLNRADQMICRHRFPTKPRSCPDVGQWLARDEDALGSEPIFVKRRHPLAV